MKTGTLVRFQKIVLLLAVTIIVTVTYLFLGKSYASESSVTDVVFHNLSYDEITKKKYPFLLDNFDSSWYKKVDPEGKKIELQEAIISNPDSIRKFYFIFDRTYWSSCGSSGCSLSVYTEVNDVYKNVFSVTTDGPVYLKRCDKEEFILLGIEDGYSEWPYKVEKFVYGKKYEGKNAKQAFQCQSAK